MNVVLDDAIEEKPGGEKVRIGMVVIRGNAVVMLEVRRICTPKRITEVNVRLRHSIASTRTYPRSADRRSVQTTLREQTCREIIIMTDSIRNRAYLAFDAFIGGRTRNGRSSHRAQLQTTGTLFADHIVIRRVISWPRDDMKRIYTGS